MNMKMLQHSVLSVIWTYPKKEREREKGYISVQITQFKIKVQYNLYLCLICSHQDSLLRSERSFYNLVFMTFILSNKTVY